MSRLKVLGPPPDVGHFRDMGLQAVSIRCLTYPCRHVGWKTFDELALIDDMIFVHVARHGRRMPSHFGQLT